MTFWEIVGVVIGSSYLIASGVIGFLILGEFINRILNSQ